MLSLRCRLSVGLVVAGLFSLTSEASGQAAPTLGWVTAGVGPGSIGAAGQLAGTIDYRGNLFTVRGAMVAEFFGDDLWDVGLMYGRGVHTGRLFLSLNAGMGLAGGTRDTGFLGSSTAPRPHRFTVPLEAQVAWRPSTFLGLALSALGSINKDGSFGGITLGLQLGKLR